MRDLCKLFALFAAVVVVGCAPKSNYSEGVPDEYREALDAAIDKSSRGEELKKLMEATPEASRRDMAYLIINMPVADRDTMNLSLLSENVEYAALAKQKYEWTQALPDDVYLNDVLPYYVVDEVRDSWRKELHELFAPLSIPAKLWSRRYVPLMPISRA